MKKLSFLALICITNSIFATDRIIKALVCNYTTSNINWSFMEVAGVTINHVKYTDYTDAVVYEEKINSKQCQDLPAIIADGFNDVPAFMSIAIIKTPDSGSSLEYFSLFNLGERPSTLEEKNMLISFNLLPLVQSTSMNVFLHARNNMLKPSVDYYNISTLGHLADKSGDRYFQNLATNSNYNFEFYICDIDNLDLCKNNNN